MTEHISKQNLKDDSTRRQFLKKVGLGAVAGTMTVPLLEDARSAGAGRKVKYRTLGKTGLRVSEIGIGGHSWAYKRVPDGPGGIGVKFYNLSPTQADIILKFIENNK